MNSKDVALVIIDNISYTNLNVSDIMIERNS